MDLHNDYNFTGLEYSVHARKLTLTWAIADNSAATEQTGSGVRLQFDEVSEFRFMPRDKSKPFSEDDCLQSFGYWVDEDWCDGILALEPDQAADPEWMTAIEFMSGAVVLVQAEAASMQVI